MFTWPRIALGLEEVIVRLHSLLLGLIWPRIIFVSLEVLPLSKQDNASNEDSSKQDKPGALHVE